MELVGNRRKMAEFEYFYRIFEENEELVRGKRRKTVENRVKNAKTP